MQFISRDHKVLVEHINKILKDNESEYKVYIIENEIDEEIYIKHSIEYFSFDQKTFKKVPIYLININVKNNTPQNILDELQELVKEEVYKNILIRTDFTITPVFREDYWVAN